jgi:large subunit ribosomal protein L9
MEVILLERIRNLGHLGDKVNVKSGFARNFLVPYGKAVSATKENLELFETRRAELEKKAADVLAVAEKAASTLNGMHIVLKRKTSEEGHLYGSVTVAEIHDAIVAQGGTVEKREIDLTDGPIRELGEYTVDAQLHSDVTAKIKVTVEAE